jgi:hypothetical protein
MIGTMLIVLAMAGQGPSAGAKLAGAEEWISRLGASRYAEREAAAAQLEKLGRLALPALVARREHRDLEVRSRVNALIAKIEGSLLLQPTPVVLDYDDRPLAEVVAAIARRSDLPLALAPGAPADRRITLRALKPEPFWSAIDRLADAADLGYNLTAPSVGAGREHPLTLAPGVARPPGPSSDHGPFRVNLISLHYQRDLSFTSVAGPGMQGRPLAGPINGMPMTTVTTTADGRAIAEAFTVRLQAAAEPRLTLQQTGALKLMAAVDDLGQSLALPAPSGPANGTMVVQHFAWSAPGAIQLQVPLRRPESPGRVIRLFRGTIPVSVATRRPEPLVVALDGAPGKTFHNDDATVVIHALGPMNPAAGAASPYNLDLSITARPSQQPAPPEAPDFGPFSPRPDLGPLQIELADASGHPLTWYVSANQPNGAEARLTLTTTGGVGPPGTLRYHGTVRAAADIPFEFREVPMP